MGKDSKPKDSGGKGKGKQTGGGSDEAASKGKGKAGKSDGLGTCTYVKGWFFSVFFLKESRSSCLSLFVLSMW